MPTTRSKSSHSSFLPTPVPASPPPFGRTTASQVVGHENQMDASQLHRVQRILSVEDEPLAPRPEIGGPGYGFDAEGSTSAQERHRAQMASYRRNSDAGRLLPSARWRIDAIWRKFSFLFEDTRTTLDGKRKPRSSPWAGPLASGTVLGRRNRRLLIYIAAASIIYLFAFRPLFGRSDHPAYPGQQSSGVKAKSRKPIMPNVSTGVKFRKRRDPRVPLPPAVMRGFAGEHPVKNGLLEVDMGNAYHPIYQLIRDARNAWDAKIDRQSRSLKEAVAEYKRRHHRSPPKGFDKWWHFVVENDVQLPDEYDQIERDILPFRALSPDDLRLRNDRASQFPDTYTLKVRKGSVRTSVTFDRREINGADERMNDQVALLQPVAKYLEDMQAVYSVHDTPSVIVGWGHRRDLLDHVEDDEYIDADDEIDLTQRGWPALCPLNSPIRARPLPAFAPPFNDTRTFVSTHSSLMDICQHPESIPIHGVLSGKEPRVSDLVPLFSLAKTNLHSDILGIPTESYLDHMDIIPWRERAHEELLWRGSNTGAHFGEDRSWKDSHRIRLLDLTTKSLGELSILSPPKSGAEGPLASNWVKEDWKAANEWYTDIAFSGYPLQCDEATCRELLDTYEFLDKMTHDQALHYKYVLDVDGNAWSARFQRLLKSGSVIFKSTIMPEWWTDRIQPWIHYVPVQIDYSDLYDALAFFRGTPSQPDSGETAFAEEIARAGRDYVETHWRRVDMTAYIFRLYLEWARLLAPRRWEMDFVYSEHMELVRE